LSYFFGRLHEGVSPFVGGLSFFRPSNIKVHQLSISLSDHLAPCFTISPGFFLPKSPRIFWFVPCTCRCVAFHGLLCVLLSRRRCFPLTKWSSAVSFPPLGVSYQLSVTEFSPPPRSCTPDKRGCTNNHQRPPNPSPTTLFLFCVGWIFRHSFPNYFYGANFVVRLLLFCYISLFLRCFVFFARDLTLFLPMRLLFRFPPQLFGPFRLSS